MADELKIKRGHKRAAFTKSMNKLRRAVSLNNDCIIPDLLIATQGDFDAFQLAHDEYHDTLTEASGISESERYFEELDNVPLHFLFLTLNSAPTTNVYVLYKYSCLDIGPICFIVPTRSIAVYLPSSSTLCFMSNLCSPGKWYSSIPMEFIRSLSRDVLTFQPNFNNGAT